MMEILSNLSGDDLVGVVAIVGGLLIAAIAILSLHWRRIRVAEIEANLKQHMLERGMSAAEIAQVVRASSQRACGPMYTGDPNYDKGSLVRVLAENGLSAEDIERVLQALHPTPNNGKPADAPRATGRV
jgi:hypothetical protein